MLSRTLYSKPAERSKAIVLLLRLILLTGLIGGTVFPWNRLQAAGEKLFTHPQETVEPRSTRLIPEHGIGSSGTLPGVGLAEGIAEITGVAVSPLLGVSVVGAWKYWRTPASERAHLPWFCQPWLWGVGLSLLSLCFLKDSLVAVIPGVFKKPLDWLELFENKASALVASTAFVPLIALTMSEYERIEAKQTGLEQSVAGLARIPLLEFLTAGIHSPWVTIPASLTLFSVVWLAFHALHVLIALSPFGLIDSALKLFKLLILGLLAGSTAIASVISPIPSLLLCLAIAVVSGLLAGWSYRLLVFGGVMVGDLLFKRHLDRHHTSAQRVAVFLAGSVQGLPARSYGWLSLNSAGELVFVRRLSLKPARQSFVLPVSDLTLQKGILYPVLAFQDTATSRPRKLAHLLPRYRGHEDQVALILGISEISELPLTLGFQAMKLWLAGFLSGRGGPWTARPPDFVA